VFQRTALSTERMNETIYLGQFLNVSNMFIVESSEKNTANRP
jgi:hypothetical protein